MHDMEGPIEGPGKRRLFIGGLHHALTEQAVRQRFGRHGDISTVQIKTKKDSKGNPVKTFAYLDITLSEHEFKKCMSTYNNVKWMGNTMQIQIAKESFLTKLERERTEAASGNAMKPKTIPRKPSHQELAERRLAENFEKAGVEDFSVKGKVPGSQIEGEKNWVVGKYGRVLPVVYIRRKDKQKVVCCDPSKFSHHVKRVKDDGKTGEALRVPPVTQLTWELPESDSANSLKRKGVFPQARPLAMQRKRVKDDLAVRREQLMAGTLSRSKVPAQRRYSSDGSSSDGEDEDESFMSEDMLSRPPPLPVNVDFEIVPDNAGSKSLSSRGSSGWTSYHSSVLHRDASGSSAEAEPPMAYDSDRDSVDTDEICTSFRTSANVADMPGPKRKADAEDHGLPEEQPASTVKRTKTMQVAEEGVILMKGLHSIGQDSVGRDDVQGRRKKSNSSNAIPEEGETSEDGQSHSDDDYQVESDDWNTSDGEDGKDDTSSPEESGDTSSPEESDDVEYGLSTPSKSGESTSKTSAASMNFEPLILDRSELQSTWMHPGKQTGEDVRYTAEAEADVGSPTSEDDCEEGGVRESPAARFDFEPLILDRAAIAEWSRTPGASAGEPSEQSGVGCSVMERDDSEDEEDGSLVDSSEVDDDEEEESDEIEDQERADLRPTVGKTDCDEDNQSSASHDSLGTAEAPKLSSKSESMSTSVVQTEGTSSATEHIDTSPLPKPEKKLSKSAKKQLAREAAEKQRLANERRMESMRKQQRALLDRQTAIKGALAAVDSKDKQGKHITFDLDEGEDDDEDEDNDSKDPHHNRSPRPDTEMAKSLQETKRGKVHLFDSDDDEDDDHDDDDHDAVQDQAAAGDDSDESDGDDDDDDDRFQIKPQYEGEAGQRLMRLEERYGGDARFKLDTRFLDQEDSGADQVGGAKAGTTSDGGDDISSDLQEEKQRSLAILQAMMGTPIVTTRKAKEPNFKDPTQLHYDPSRDEHSKYELRADDGDKESDGKRLEQELKREKRKLEEERAKMPEVSKEKFFQVSTNLKDAFRRAEDREEGVDDDEEEEEEGGGRGSGGTFTFFGGDESDGEEKPAESRVESTGFDLASSLLPSKRFKYDSSDMEDEEEEEEGMDVERSKDEAPNQGHDEEGKDTTVPQTFFFQTDDPRLKGGSQTFCRPKDHSAMMSTWEELKAKLQTDFRRRHQKAVRDQKTAKKWVKKSGKNKK